MSNMERRLASQSYTCKFCLQKMYIDYCSGKGQGYCHPHSLSSVVNVAVMVVQAVVSALAIVDILIQQFTALSSLISVERESLDRQLN